MRNMTKKKWLIIGLVVVALVAIFVVSVPVMAADASPPTPPAQITPANKPGAIIRLLLIQDQTKAFGYVEQAETAGKITSDQAIEIEQFWTLHHAQFAWNFVLRRLLRAQNESNVKTYLDKAVANGKITVDQENKVLAMWEVLHTPAPTTTTPAPATTTTSP
jgi:hypothetical protein